MGRRYGQEGFPNEIIYSRRINMTRSNNFGDISFHQKKEKLREEIWQAINDLQGLHQNQFYKVMLQNCRSVITPIASFDDMSRLPSLLKAVHRRKTDCVVAAVCRTISYYWNFYNGEEAAAEYVEAHLAALKRYVEKGLNAYEIRGNSSAGHVLVEKE